MQALEGDPQSTNRQAGARGKGSRWKRIVLGTCVYGAITLATVLILDVLLIALGLFPPQYNYGHPELGWVGAHPTGEMKQQTCVEYAYGRSVRYTRNEDGLRTSFPAADLRENRERLKVGVTGDSQTELCAPNEQTHFGVLERELEKAGVPAAVFADGTGKYSPLQAYLAVRRFVPDYAPQVLVINLYTGNDFYDMLRVDDRPHFVPDGIGGYRIAPPVWYQEMPPGAQPKSRTLFVLRSIAQETGIRNIWIRVRYLHDVAESQEQGLLTVLRYMNDLRKSTTSEVGYQAAFTAQILNQQLFFHRFPGSREESVRRVRALLELIRDENPGRLLVMSPLPSYQLAQETPVDTALRNVFERMPVTYEEGVEEELALYETLRLLSDETGWIFADNLEGLRAHKGPERLYNDFDYHLDPVASEIIGRMQSAALLPHLSRVALHPQ